LIVTRRLLLSGGVLCGSLLRGSLLRGRLSESSLLLPQNCCLASGGLLPGRGVRIYLVL